MGEQKRKLRAAAMVIIFSLILLNEGTVRLSTVTTPGNHHVHKDDIPHQVLIIGAVFEVFIGVIGLITGLLNLVFTDDLFSSSSSSSSSSLLTKFAMFTNTTIGWYYFIVYVFIAPAWAIANDPLDGELSHSETKGARVLSILASFSFCLAALGGQFAALHGLLQHQLDKESEVLTKRYYLSRMFGYSLNLLFAGLAILTLGSFLSAQLGGGKVTHGPYAYPPCIVWHPALTTVTGCILTLHGTFGMTTAFLSSSSSSLITKVFIIFSLFDWIWLLSVLGLSEPSLTPGGLTAAPASVIQSLSLAITLLPAYFAYELYQQAV